MIDSADAEALAVLQTLPRVQTFFEATWIVTGLPQTQNTQRAFYLWWRRSSHRPVPLTIPRDESPYCTRSTALSSLSRKREAWACAYAHIVMARDMACAHACAHAHTRKATGGSGRSRGGDDTGHGAARPGGLWSRDATPSALVMDPLPCNPALVMTPSLVEHDSRQAGRKSFPASTRDYTREAQS